MTLKCKPKKVGKVSQLINVCWYRLGEIIKNLEFEERENLRSERHEHGGGTQGIDRRSGGARFPAKVRSDHPRSGGTQHGAQQSASQGPTAMPRGNSHF